MYFTRIEECCFVIHSDHLCSTYVPSHAISQGTSEKLLQEGRNHLDSQCGVLYSNPYQRNQVFLLVYWSTTNNVSLIYRVTDSSTEAFILRLYRQDNKVDDKVCSGKSDTYLQLQFSMLSFHERARLLHVLFFIFLLMLVDWIYQGFL